jgi:tRNA threonylcarbamoyladenosine biosynthesis protein TsaE
MKIVSKSIDDTRLFAKDLLVEISKQSLDRATILDLVGGLGAGKTTLTQMLGIELGVAETMQSPTFVLMKIYKTENNKFKNLIHIDAYRIEHVDEAGILGLPKLFADPSNLICIEWSEKIKEVMPEKVVKIECELLENDEHGYEIKA